MTAHPPAARLRFLLAMAIFAGSAFAQTPAANQEQVLYFLPSTSAQRSQEIAVVIEAIADIPQASVDLAHGSLTLRGTADRLSSGEWLFHQLDTSAPPNPASPAYPVPGAADEVAQVFYPANIKTPQRLQEVVTAIRTMGDSQRLMACPETGAVALRGPASQAALAEWLMSALDKPAGWRPPASQNWAAYEYQGSASPRAINPATVRVFFPSNAGTPQGLQEVVTLTRTLADLQRLIPLSTAQAVVLRGTAGQTALAEWVLNALDKPDGWQPPAGQNPAAYQYISDAGVSAGDDFVRVFYLPPATTPPELQALVSQIRTASSCQRIMGVTAQHVLALRGTASQVTTAEQLVASRYPTSPKP